jgi:uroporphyrinogen decarboxylase
VNTLQRVLGGQAVDVPPIWLMRQAGRYQRSYRALRKRHPFERLCREPELAARVALDAVRQFDFDAAILFSDLLFPLEAMGFGLSYAEGPPKLDRRLTPAVLARLRPAAAALPRLSFQRDGVAATRQALDRDRALIGFIGGPWTLFVYAVDGTHAGALTAPKRSPGLYRRFARRLMPVLRGMIREQLGAGADLVMIFDTAAGELAPAEFDALTATDLAGLARVAPGRVGYYARGVQAAHLASEPFAAAPWAGIGIDWRWSLAEALGRRPGPGFIQGNFDPALLHAEGRELNQAIARFVGPLRSLSRAARRGWVCGLGHGVFPGTPEASVRRFVGRVREEMAR